MDLGIQGRRAAVAAASSGLGLATARELGRAGCRVAICARGGDRLSRTAHDIGAVAIPADVSTPPGASGFVEAAIAELGGVDILVTNAGGPPRGRFDDVDIDAYEAALRLNLLSVVAMCETAVPPMRERHWGRVVGITSVAVRQPIRDLILSNTARTGATGFLKSLALEVAADGVTVNTLQPGFHDTERVRTSFGGDVDALAEQVPARRIGDPADFGAAAAFLCSEPARFITGVAVPVDGGQYLGLQ